MGKLGNHAELVAFEGLLNKVPKVGKYLGGKKMITVLAPSNEAIAALGQDTLLALTANKSGLEKLSAVLSGHILQGKHTIASLDSSKLVSVNGRPVNLNGIKVIGNPIVADNGVMLVVDGIIR
ncbi:hypothetical protein FPE01S_03_03410 [Flavihumibacter petaseus NBRC 106054]|uniref:FAS1 domain-containing protein n=1 Tax=Flavihumibacter petaseus NBRC 106054 TaxID=1220578 RepID=A0A0E9N3C8_9BACT|nr:hypothetical protein FPE01S_03_03410 [Flavihumibacter petaseus NBRC 106054]